MNLRDWYFKQLVSQGDMDEAFDWVEEAEHAAADDMGMVGVMSAGDGTENAPPDLSVVVAGPIIAYDKAGQRIYDATATQLVDCTTDEYGVATSVAAPGNEKWVSVFIKATRRLEDPEIDGNNNEVYTRQYEDTEIFVRQSAEAAIGAAVRPPLLAGAILLFDLYRINGQVSFQNADFDRTRREDWLRFVGASLGTISHGTAHDAVADLYAIVDAIAAAFPFAFVSTWFGPAAVSGAAPPVTTVQEALDAVVYDLAQAAPAAGGALLVGAQDSGAFPGGFVTPWAAASVQAALMSLGTNLDGHIGGAPPAHPASSITFTPYSWLASVQVQNAIQEIVDDLADATAAGGATRIGNDAYLWIAATTLRGQIREIVDDLAATGAGVGGATRVGTEAIAGTPESIAVSTVQAVLSAIYGHLNARTERATDETVDGAWTFDNGGAIVNQAREAQNVRFLNNPWFKALQGGSVSPYHRRGNVASKLVGLGVSWANPWGGANSIPVGAGAAVVDDVAVVYTAAGYRRVVFAESNTFAVGWIDPMDPTVFGSIPLAGFFPGGGTTYTIDAICTDEKYIYVKVSILTGAVVTHHVNAFDVTGTLHPGGWAATGTTLAGTGTSPFIASRMSNICVAQLDAAYQYATVLATVNDWQNGGSGLMVSIINAATGVVTASGDGDVPALPGPYVVANEYPQGGICSDGTNIWFTFRETGGGVTRGGFATATIANPLVGSGLAGLPYGIPAADSNCILFDGDVIWYIDWTGALWLYRVADQVIDAKSNAAAALGAARFATFDGLNVWIQDLEAGNDTIALHQIPCAQVLATGSGTQDVAAMIRFSASFMQLSEAAAVPFQQMGRLCFDGDSVWMVMQGAGGGALSGVARKLPRAGTR